MDWLFIIAQTCLIVGVSGLILSLILSIYPAPLDYFIKKSYYKKINGKAKRRKPQKLNSCL